MAVHTNASFVYTNAPFESSNLFPAYTNAAFERANVLLAYTNAPFVSSNVFPVYSNTAFEYANVLPEYTNAVFVDTTAVIDVRSAAHIRSACVPIHVYIKTMKLPNLNIA